MTAQLLASELNNLIQESKRKHNDLRQAAEKSLEDLKSLRTTSEAQVASDLSQKLTFVNPFIIACGTKNAKFTGIAIVCLQRLIVSGALPRSRLSQVLEALQQATSAGLDVQLKILQALPSLLSNYAADVKGELLVTALNICFILQSSKNAIVNNTSAATLQQLVVSVFDKVVNEDRSGSDAPNVGEAPTERGNVPLMSAALDAFRVFNDICLLTESQRPEYLRFSGLTQTFGLELIESVLTNHAGIFSTHPEQAHILRTRVMPFIISALRGKPSFATSVRLVRILYTLLRRHMSILPAESGEAMDILTQLLDQDTALWKRSLCMEVFRGIFAEPGLFRRIFMLYDAKEGQKPILKNLTATFVRVSTEKPSVIGLGHQSTIPVANPYASIGASTDQAMLEASGVTGIISGSVGSDGHNTGISTQWSTMRVPCIDQLDKTEPPSIPESYLYSLTLACMTSLSEGLAKFILPLTVPGDSRNRKRSTKPEGEHESSASRVDGGTEGSTGRLTLERSAFFKRNPVPTNPLTLEDHPLHAEVKICAAFIEECWPAILATCSTFLYAALDSECYHGLVRAFQKFTHVSGLLQLTTPRDAFLTTLGKAAVPPNVFTACLNAGTARATTPTASGEMPNSIFSNARGLLSVDSLVGPTTPSTEKPRQLSTDLGPSTLNTRNLLCLRALVNLGIALGPTLSSSWRIILETLQQADFVLFSSGRSAGRTPTATKATDQQADQEVNQLLANFSTEIRAVETAASRLFESTIDFPNSAFVEVVTAVCNLVERHAEDPSEPSSRPQSPPSTGPSLKTPTGPHRRQLSISTSAYSGPNQENQFALAKLGDLASINLERLLSYPPHVSGWNPLVSELITTLSSSLNTAPVRLRAAETLVRIVMEASSVATSYGEEPRGKIQTRLLNAFRDALLSMQLEDRQVTLTSHSTDVDVHKTILDGLRGILENCGESLVQGWEITFEIIDTIFANQAFVSNGEGTDNHRATLIARSARLIRPSFASLQLICSDFLPSLPNSCFLNLVDTLYKFCSQDDDLNVALTTVTFFWAVSDFLSGTAKSMPVTVEMVQEGGNEALLDLAADAGHPRSRAALWMLLLLRLSSVATDQRLELRNSAIQTLMRIISAYGDSLSAEAWLISLRSVIFKLLSSIEDELRAVQDASAKDKQREDWKDTAIVVIQGVSHLCASYLHVLTAHRTFTSVWKELLGHFATMLEFNILDVSAATFSAVRDILKQATEKDQQGFTKEMVDLTWELWSRDVPVPKDLTTDRSGDNQKCLLVWVEALIELYRLIDRDLDVEIVRRMLTLLREAMQHATPGAYTSDVDYVTPLQGRILDICKMVRTDLPGVPSAMISQLADFVSLSFTQEDISPSPTQKRTYVAMSKESMSILQSLITRNAAETDIYKTDAFASALAALQKPIALKYSFPVRPKSTEPWREATKCFLAVLASTLPHIRAADVPRATFQKIWHLIIGTASGILNAECHRAQQGSNILADEEFDIASFRALRALIIPSLGAEGVPNKTRKAYAEALFRTSIIHAPAPSESSVIDGSRGGDVVALSALYKPRIGRTIDPTPTKRVRMSYVCLEELFSLVAEYDECTTTPSIVVQPPTPGLPLRSPPPRSSGPKEAENGEKEDSNGKTETTHELHIRLARTAAPYLILRCALSIRAYIADQPLRGRMPQPLSQRKELTTLLRWLVDLRSEPDAIRDTPNVDSDTRKHLLRLYPLLVAAVQVAGSSGDGKVLGLIREALDVVGGELGV
ncbi:endosomal peripheral membrane protein [Coniochaeta sp. PMI_546]|nr:endosomal peripheral membrane protein [Coniochaeta sp. PMI_546]